MKKLSQKLADMDVNFSCCNALGNKFNIIEEVKALEAQIEQYQQKETLDKITSLSEELGLYSHQNKKEIEKCLKDARSTAMINTYNARIPECGDFGDIAQNLDYVCNELGIGG